MQDRMRRGLLDEQNRLGQKEIGTLIENRLVSEARIVPEERELTLIENRLAQLVENFQNANNRLYEQKERLFGIDAISSSEKGGVDAVTGGLIANLNLLIEKLENESCLLARNLMEIEKL